MDVIAYVRRPAASMGLPKRVLVTVIQTPQGERLYDRNSPVDPQNLRRNYSPEVLRESDKC